MLGSAIHVKYRSNNQLGLRKVQTWHTSSTRLMLLASFSYSATMLRRSASRLAAHSRGSTTAELGPDAMLFTTNASHASLASALQSLPGNVTPSAFCDWNNP